jgi:hypothetical protein
MEGNNAHMRRNHRLCPKTQHAWFFIRVSCTRILGLARHPSRVRPPPPQQHLDVVGQFPVCTPSSHRAYRMGRATPRDRMNSPEKYMLHIYVHESGYKTNRPKIDLVLTSFSARQELGKENWKMCMNSPTM